MEQLDQAWVRPKIIFPHGRIGFGSATTFYGFIKKSFQRILQRSKLKRIHLYNNLWMVSQRSIMVQIQRLLQVSFRTCEGGFHLKPTHISVVSSGTTQTRCSKSHFIFQGFHLDLTQGSPLRTISPIMAFILPYSTDEIIQLSFHESLFFYLFLEPFLISWVDPQPFKNSFWSIIYML